MHSFKEFLFKIRRGGGNSVYKHFDEMSKRAATPSRIDDHSCIGSICSKKSNKGAIPYLSVSV